MKVSKKISVLILITLSLCIAYIYTLNDDKKYVLTNVVSSNIDSIEIFHKDDLITYDTETSECKDILKLIKKYTQKGIFSSLDDVIPFDPSFPKNSMEINSDNHLIKINFTSNTEVKLNNTSITCKYMVLDIYNKTLYYWFQASSCINKMSIENVDLNKLKELVK